MSSEMLKGSIDRAIRVLDSPADYEGYVSLKIAPVGHACCCFHCWPETWAEVNQHIRPCGPLLDEGDVAVIVGETSLLLRKQSDSGATEADAAGIAGPSDPASAVCNRSNPNSTRRPGRTRCLGLWTR